MPMRIKSVSDRDGTVVEIKNTGELKEWLSGQGVFNHERAIGVVELRSLAKRLTEEPEMLPELPPHLLPPLYQTLVAFLKYAPRERLTASEIARLVDRDVRNRVPLGAARKKIALRHRRSLKSVEKAHQRLLKRRGK